MKKLPRLVICVALAVILVGTVSAYAADSSTDITLTVSDGSDYIIVIPSEKAEESTSPQTGDSSNIIFWISLLCISVIAVVVTMIVRRMQQYCR